MNPKNLRIARPLAQLRQGRNDWYRIITNNGDTAEVLIYDEIGYWGVTAGDFVRDLQGITASQITLRINSPGGDVFDGVAIYNAVKSHRANVTVHVDGLAASAASFIAMAGDTVRIARNATMMIHDAAGMCIGNAKDMDAMSDLLARCSDNIADIYTQKAGGTVEEWRERMRAETWYNATEAVEAGLADEVIQPSSDDTVSNSWDLSIFNYPSRDRAPDPVIVPVVGDTVPAPPPDPPVETAPEPPPTLDPASLSDLIRAAFSKEAVKCQN